jgi:hypothetical protein
MGKKRTWMSLLGCALPLVAAGCGQPPPDELAVLPVRHLDFSSASPAGPDEPRPADKPAIGTRPEWEAEGYRPWRHIVIHHSATPDGSAARFDKAHRQRGWDELGYHFVIDNGRGGPDGRIEVGTRWKHQKWGAHTGGTPRNEYNSFGIGICLVGDFSGRMPSRAQLESLNRLVTYLAARHDIPPGHVIGHCDAPGATTDCPGRLLHDYIHKTLRADLTRRLAEGQ